RADEQGSAALDRITARFALPFAAGEIERDFLLRQALERHPRFADTFAYTVRRYEMPRRPDAMRTAGQTVQAGARLRFGLRFGQDAAATGDDGIRTEHESIRVGRRNGFRFLACEPARKSAGQLVFLRGFVDFRRDNFVRFNADLLEKRKP